MKGETAPEDAARVPTGGVLDSGVGRLTLVLAAITFLTALYLLLQGQLVPAFGAILVALGFVAFAVVGVLSLEALELAWLEHRRYVGLAGGLFGAGIAFGVVLYALGFDLMGFFLEMLGEEFGEEFVESEEPGAEAEFELTAGFFIVQNTPPFLISILGAFTVGLLTLVVMVFNGILVGNIAVSMGVLSGFDVILVLLIPHGVFELAALFVAAGVGFRLVHRFAQRLRGTRDSFVTKAYLYRTALLVFFAWLVLVLAAFIEAYLTIAIAETIFGDRLEGAEETPAMLVSLVLE